MRKVAEILEDLRCGGHATTEVEELLIEAIEALAEHSHPPVPIADVVRTILHEEARS